ncbi:hypothetical protein MKW98_003792 [Papaver atlanticum]|uniref:Uncharacterized protein n=1 Tax=Papaver atlanticum TaxID=357466 RepID=A0AAD4XT39_9MAGN|nr:hypothetical protein MKW98_003792 [Papaver atlanticum]
MADGCVDFIHLFILWDLLGMSLKTTTTSWECGELVSCGFTPSEEMQALSYLMLDQSRKDAEYRMASSVCLLL